jgi:predicted ATPase/DNA-binding SARP family transcriptional activator
MTVLELKLLGGLGLRQDGLPIADLKSQKGQALLCYLAVTRQTVSRAALAGLFWPEKPEAEAYTNLRKVLARLKPLWPYLVIRRQTLALDEAASHTVDVADFEANAAFKADFDHQRLAVDLFQGDFLDGFYLDDAPLFDEWMLAQRARLRHLVLDVLERLTAHFTAQGVYEDAIRYSQRTLDLEPWREEAHRALMRLLALTGQRSAALVQYETCRSRLASDLGVEPTADTVSLFVQIKSGTFEGLGSGQPTIATGPPATPLNNLPAPNTPFVGRARELAALEENLASRHVRLLTIVGIGGIGKTRLALACGMTLFDAPAPAPFPDGVVFISLARLETPDQLIPTIAEAVNLRFLAGSEPQAQLHDYLRQKALLLILDNFEHLRGQARLLEALLQAAPGLKILVTSRERLNLQAEHLFPMGGMDLPDPAAAAPRKQLADYSAIQLFLECARRVRPDFVLTAENESAVLDICRAVHGVPLGIILAAAWLESLAPRQIAAEIHANLDFLGSIEQDVPERQRSLRAAFNHSWRLLPEQERGVFQRLSVFRGGFTRPAAQSVAAASLRDMQGLVARSLLTISLEGRYSVHELLRQFAEEKLADTADNEAGLRDRHSAYYCNFLHVQSDNWHTGRQLETFAAVTRESDNVLRAWNWAVERGECLRLVAAIDSWGWYLQWRGQLADAEILFRRLGEQVQGLAPDHQVVGAEFVLLWAKARAWQGLCAPNSATCLEHLQASLSLLERPELTERDTRRDKAFVLYMLGGANYGLDRKTARQLLEHSLALYEACSDLWGTSSVLTDLGHLDWATGDYTRAKARTEAALAMHQARGDLRAMADSIAGLGWIEQHLGHMERAVKLRREALNLTFDLGDRLALTGRMADLAASLIWQGAFSETRQWTDQALAICQDLGRRGQEGYVRLHIAMVQMFAGQYEQARREGALTLVLVKEGGDHGVEASVHWLLGSLALLEPDCEVARAAFLESRRLYEEVEDNYLGLVLPGPGYAACLDRRLADARRHFAEALQFALALKDHLYLMLTLPGVALYLSLAGEIVWAVEVWELAQSLTFVGNSKWHADIVGLAVDGAAAVLTREDRLAANVRGQALNLWDTAQALVYELRDANGIQS